MDSDVCLHTGFLVAAAAALASLVSAMIAAVRTRLWSSFRQRCESPLLAHPETLVSCLLGRSRVFPDFLPASRGTLVPSGCLHAANPSSLPGI